MLKRVTPIEFIKAATRGRTEPSVLLCECPDGTEVELVAKFSACCDEREINLAREVIAACLAADLGLPVPEPFLVEAPREWVDLVPDPGRRAKINGSSHVAFGSRLVTKQFSAWTIGTEISDAMLPTAAAIFTFDAIIQNSDRRGENPNCLVRGDEIRIFDHELAFVHRLVIGWRPPWTTGSLRAMENPGFHIFRNGLKGKIIDYDQIKASWNALSDDQIASYESALPLEWGGVSNSVKDALTLVKDARDNIDGCLSEIKRVLV